MIGPTALCPEGIELLLLDLDGTVMIDGTVIHDRVADAVLQARERGCMVCISTGRAYNMVPPAMRGPESVDYIICANGSRVYDTFEGVLYERLMTREQILEAMDALKPLHAGWNAFVGDHSYFEWRGVSYMVTGRREPLGAGDVVKSLHADAGLSLARKAVVASRKAVRFASRLVMGREGMSQVMSVRPYIEKATEGIGKVGCSLPTEELCDRAMVILDHLGHFEVARMSRTELEITARGVTKGVAATWLMDYLGVDKARTVAFGDSENDATLIDVSGTFVAMGNADGRIKKRADDICEPNYDDGVARWLERAMSEADGASYVQ